MESKRFYRLFKKCCTPYAVVELAELEPQFAPTEYKQALFEHFIIEDFAISDAMEKYGISDYVIFDMRVGIICKYIFDIFDYVDGDDDCVVHEVRKLIETDSNDVIIQELRDLVSRCVDIGTRFGVDKITTTGRRCHNYCKKRLL